MKPSAGGHPVCTCTMQLVRLWLRVASFVHAGGRGSFSSGAVLREPARSYHGSGTVLIAAVGGRAIHTPRLSRVVGVPVPCVSARGRLANLGPVADVSEAGGVHVSPPAGSTGQAHQDMVASSRGNSSSMSGGVATQQQQQEGPGEMNQFSAPPPPVASNGIAGGAGQEAMRRWVSRERRLKLPGPYAAELDAVGRSLICCMFCPVLGVWDRTEGWACRCHHQVLILRAPGLPSCLLLPHCLLPPCPNQGYHRHQATGTLVSSPAEHHYQTTSRPPCLHQPYHHHPFQAVGGPCRGSSRLRRSGVTTTTRR